MKKEQDLEEQWKKAIVKMADILQDLSMKLCHIIERMKENYYRD